MTKITKTQKLEQIEKLKHEIATLSPPKLSQSEIERLQAGVKKARAVKLGYDPYNNGSARNE